MKVLPFVRHSLGAEELIELGRADYPSNGNVPFLSPRLRGRVAMGQSEAPAPAPVSDDFIVTALSKDLELLGKISMVPLDIMAKSETVTFRATGDLLDNVPAIDVLLARILLLGNAAVRLGLDLPSLKDGCAGIVNGIAAGFSATGTSAQNQKAIDEAEAAILAQAPDKDRVKKIFDSTGVSGDDLTPATPPPAGAQGSSILAGQRPKAVMLVLSKW